MKSYLQLLAMLGISMLAQQGHAQDQIMPAVIEVTPAPTPTPPKNEVIVLPKPVLPPKVEPALPAPPKIELPQPPKIIQPSPPVRPLPPPSPPKPKPKIKKVDNKVRVLAHITTDKPIYKPNDVMFIEVFVIDPTTKKPAVLYQNKYNRKLRKMEMQLYEPYASLKILNNKDQDIFKKYQRVKRKDGTIVFTYKIPKGQSGGTYTIKVTSSAFPEVYRKFRINTYSQPNLFVTVDFDKKNYQPGDSIAAKVKVRKPDGEAIPFGSNLSLTMYIKTKKGIRSQIVNIKNKLFNRQGEALVRFDLSPDAEIEALSLPLRVYLGYSKTPVVSQHSVPILKKDAFIVEFFSEFGTQGFILKPDLKQKIYFQVVSDPKKYKKGADKVGISFHKAQLIEVKKKEKSVIQDDIQSMTMGRGVFTFTADGDAEGYALKIFKTGNNADEGTLFYMPMEKFGKDQKLDLSLVMNNSPLFGFAQDKKNPEDNMPLELTLYSNQKTTPLKFDPTSIPMELTILNKDKVVYSNKFMIDAKKLGEIPMKFQANLYEKVPNGGVFILKLRSTIENKPDDIVCDKEDYECRKELHEKAKAEVLAEILEEKSRCNRWGCRPPPTKPPVAQSEKYLYTFERLIFLKPRSTLPFSITTDKEDYQPGDRVSVNVNFDPSWVDHIKKDERFYASITVTDTSSFIKVPKHKHMPSVPTMIYLEKEIKQMNGELDEFQYSKEYIDQLFDQTQGHEHLNTQENLDNIDCLLGQQEWRRNLIEEDMNLLNYKISKMKWGSKEQTQFKYLLGQRHQAPTPVWRNRGAPMAMRGDAMLDAMPMAMAMPMEGMAMEKEADNGMRMRKADGMKRNEAQGRMMRKEAMPSPPRPRPKVKPGPQKRIANNKASGKSESTDEDEQEPKRFQGEADFMAGIKPNTRNWYHKIRRDFNRFDRIDFTQTLLFNSARELEFTKDRTYTVNSRFSLNDQVSTFKITVNLFSSEGKYAFASQDLVSSMPAYSKFTLPTTMVMGDKIDVPINIVNNHRTFKLISMKVREYVFQPKYRVVSELIQKVELGPKQSKSITFKLDTDNKDHQSQEKLQVEAELYIDDELQDKISKGSLLISNGFEDQISTSGRIGIRSKAEPEKYEVERTASYDFEIPQSISQSPRFTVKMFAKPLDSILDAIEALIRNPYGCFEQTSSVTYPMVMALQLLNEMQGQLTDEEAILRVKKMKYDIMEKLKGGYEKLIGFETSSQGYEWFGKAPGHEALSAYGIAQFNDMKKVVRFVDDKVLKKNTDWLIGRKDRKRPGHFELNSKALDTFGRASQNITDAYIVWVLTQDGKFSYDDLKDEFKALEELTQTTKDPYLLSLYAGALTNVKKLDEAFEIADRVASAQNEKNGSVEGAESSITNSRGQSLLLETTSLALINWLNLDPSKYSKNIDLGVGYLLSSIKNGGRFGSTQSTVLSLKALVRYTQIYQGISGSGTFVLYFNGEKVKSVNFSDEEKGALSKLDFSEEFYRFYQKKYQGNTCGQGRKMNVKLAIEDYQSTNDDGFALSYIMAMDFLNAAPADPEKAPISFTMKKSFHDQQVAVGNSQTLDVTIGNNGGPQGMLISRISVSSCYDIDMNQLEILKERAMIDNFEISADKTQLTLYWTYLKEEEQKKVSLNLLKKYGGLMSTCQSRASQAYLYYQDEDKVWLTESSAEVICNEKVHDYSSSGSSIVEEPKPVPRPQPVPRPRPQPPIVRPQPVPLPRPCPPGQFCILEQPPQIELPQREKPKPRPRRVRKLEDWELALREWDAQPNGVVAAAKPPAKKPTPQEQEVGCCQISANDNTCASHEYEEGKCIKLFGRKQIGCTRNLWVPGAIYNAKTNKCESQKEPSKSPSVKKPTPPKDPKQAMMKKMLQKGVNFQEFILSGLFTSFQAQIQDANTQFQSYDLDKSGVITQEEYQKVQKVPLRKTVRLKQSWNQFAKDKKMGMTFNEFYLMNMVGSVGIRNSTVNMIVQKWYQMDQDRSNTLSLVELTRAYIDEYYKKSPIDQLMLYWDTFVDDEKRGMSLDAFKAVNQVKRNGLEGEKLVMEFKRLDKDGSGALTWKEFKSQQITR